MGFPATAVIEVRATGSDTQCGGGFNSARGGTDYSQQNAAQATGTVTSATTTVTATTGIFTAAMVGNYITDGTTYKEITGFTSSLIVTVDSAPSWTAATVYVGGALASPGKASGIATFGNIVQWKKGTYSATTTTPNVAGGIVSCPASSFSITNAITWIGYNSVRGDNPLAGSGNQPSFEASGIASVALFTIANVSVNIENIQFDGKSLTGMGGVVVSGNRNNARKCTFKNFKNHASDGVNLQECYVTGCATTVAVNNFTYIEDCVVTGNVDGVDSEQDGAAIIRCIIASNTGKGVAQGGGGWGINVQDSTIANNTGDGVSNFRAAFSSFRNCIVYGNGGKGLNDNGDNLNGTLIESCAFGANTSGNYTAGARSLNEVTLTGNPFNNAGVGDYSLNANVGAGGACRAAGIPGVFPGTLTTGYLDIGAAQHQEAVSGGIIDSPTFTGGFCD